MNIKKNVSKYNQNTNSTLIVASFSVMLAGTRNVSLKPAWETFQYLNNDSCQDAIGTGEYLFTVLMISLYVCHSFAFTHFN